MNPRIILPITLMLLLGVFFLSSQVNAQSVKQIKKSPIFSHFDTGEILHKTAPLDRFAGKVVSVADGDTITVLEDKRPVRIRLYGIDCPEKRQAFGKKAKQFTSEKCFGKKVEILVMDKDRYGRLVANVILPDGSNLNKQLVPSGFAWHYKKYAPDDLDLFVSQEYARKEKLGLWADPNSPVPPWEWRKRKK